MQKGKLDCAITFVEPDGTRVVADSWGIREIVKPEGKKMTISVQDFLKTRTTRSRKLDGWYEELSHLYTEGVSFKDMQRYLEENGVKATVITISNFLIKRGVHQKKVKK